MDLDIYALFLVGSILVSLSIIVIALAVLFINYIYNKYWKTVQIFKIYSYDLNHQVEPTIFVTPNANTVVTTNGQN
jgi:hypothetical protein